jgi:hypothetical protein
MDNGLGWEGVSMKSTESDKTLHDTLASLGILADYSGILC